MTATGNYVRLDGGAVSLVFKLETNGAADLIYLGELLPQGEALAALATSQARAPHESQPDTPPVPGLLPQRKDGWMGRPALEAWSLQGGTFEPLPTDLRVADWQTGKRDLLIRYSDAASSIQFEQNWSLGASDAITVHSRVSNFGKGPVRIAHAAAITLPIPMRFSHVTRYSGRWTHEMQDYREPLAPGGIVQTSSHGKPGFGGNWLILDDPQSGAVLGAHLAWSGDYETRVDCDQPGNSDGRAVLQVAAQLNSGEVELAPGEA
ncbi:MAG: glycoside hydrolase family 36 N-terminal domain-containing protein, partial [Pseudomonadota bacterium]